MWIVSLIWCCAWSARPSTTGAVGLRHISLSRLSASAVSAIIPTTSGTSLALKCQGSAAITKLPIAAM